MATVKVLDQSWPNFETMTFYSKENIALSLFHYIVRVGLQLFQFALEPELFFYKVWRFFKESSEEQIRKQGHSTFQKKLSFLCCVDSIAINLPE